MEGLGGRVIMFKKNNGAVAGPLRPAGRPVETGRSFFWTSTIQWRWICEAGWHQAAPSLALKNETHESGVYGHVFVVFKAVHAAQSLFRTKMAPYGLCWPGCWTNGASQLGIY